MATGKEQSIQTAATSGLTEAEMREKLTFAVAESVSEFEQIAEEIQILITTVECMLPDVQRVVKDSVFGRDALDKARRVVMKSREAIENRNVEAMRAQRDMLTRTKRMFNGVMGSGN
jgi:molecular chaperone DnaK